MTIHPKRPSDPNQLAKSIIDIATGQAPDRDPTPEELGKSAKAVARGKAGGAKGTGRNRPLADSKQATISAGV